MYHTSFEDEETSRTIGVETWFEGGKWGVKVVWPKGRYFSNVREFDTYEQACEFAKRIL